MDPKHIIIKWTAPDVLLADYSHEILSFVSLLNQDVKKN